MGYFFETDVWNNSAHSAQHSVINVAIWWSLWLKIFAKLHDMFLGMIAIQFTRQVWCSQTTVKWFLWFIAVKPGVGSIDCTDKSF